MKRIAPKFQDEKNLIGGMSNRDMKETLSQVYDAANFLDRAGLNKLDVSVKHSKHQGISVHDFDHEVLYVTINLPDIYSTTFSISDDRHDPHPIQSYDLLHDKGPVCYDHLSSPSDMVDHMLRGIRQAITEAYGTKHTPDKNRPNIQFIRQDNDPYHFILLLENAVKDKTDGYQIKIIHEDELELEQQVSLVNRFLSSVGLRKKPEAPAAQATNARPPEDPPQP
ncbi:MAG: hypothetical protein CMH27_10465 [Micavibrio sp.]|nr:hypothetical protein [Micavibrio sp.]|tara:strand:- start:2571 stop:3242 length:672 start_codon:yes stop_codon:yes gene_type:complete